MDEPLTAAERDGGEPDPAASTAAPAPSVIVQAETVRIRDLMIDRKAIADYLQGIAGDKQVIALVHALEVGVTELLARRERFRR
jgi:hypothetical protein